MPDRPIKRDPFLRSKVHQVCGYNGWSRDPAPIALDEPDVKRLDVQADGHRQAILVWFFNHPTPKGDEGGPYPYIAGVEVYLDFASYEWKHPHTVLKVERMDLNDARFAIEEALEDFWADRHKQGK